LLFDGALNHLPAPSGRRLLTTVRKLALGLIRERYADFGPTLAHEKLVESHGMKLSVETLRQWMIAEGIWPPRAQRASQPHPPRARRACLGHLVQIDGCDHEWFESRAPRCVALVYVDDATSRLMQLRFAESESTFDYFEATRGYLEQHGRPVAFYSDKAGIFRVNAKQPKGGDRATQFSRAMGELNIDLLCANSPQAKGRVERTHKTLQDRLTKELRLRGIASIDAANVFAPWFVGDYNRRFARAPLSRHDPSAAQAHRRPLAGPALEGAAQAHLQPDRPLQALAVPCRADPRGDGASGKARRGARDPRPRRAHSP
jgi:hypothetical protein